VITNYFVWHRTSSKAWRLCHPIRFRTNLQLFLHWDTTKAFGQLVQTYFGVPNFESNSELQSIRTHRIIVILLEYQCSEAVKHKFWLLRLSDTLL